MNAFARWSSAAVLLATMGCERNTNPDPNVPPQPGYGQPQPGYGQPQPGYGQPQPGYGQPQPGYGQPQPAPAPAPAPAPTAAPAAAPNPLALPCQNDAACGTFRCNVQAQRCAMPCANAATDCQPGLTCMAGLCIPPIPGTPAQ